MAPSSGRDAFVQLLHDKGFLDKGRIMTWKRDTVSALLKWKRIAVRGGDKKGLVPTSK